MLLKTGIKHLVLYFCLLGLAKGSCISYGHSCWGAHGKRSGDQKNEQKRLPERWALLQIIPERVSNDGFLLQMPKISSRKLASPDEQYTNNMNLQFLRDSPLLEKIRTIDPPSSYPLSSDENLNSNNNNIPKIFPKSKHWTSKYKKLLESQSEEQPNDSNATEDDIERRNSRFMKMLDNDLGA